MKKEKLTRIEVAEATHHIVVLVVIVDLVILVVLVSFSSLSSVSIRILPMYIPMYQA